MRPWSLVLWLLVPVGLGAYHFGPGQDRLKLDEAGRALERAADGIRRAEWASAIHAYDEALALLPADRTEEARRIRLERAKAQMQGRQLSEAHAELETLVEELRADPGADPRLLADAQSALANAQYYLCWLMRLEGLPREVWEPEIESARQHYRLLAEQADAAGDQTPARTAREDLESAIRLARMALSDLQGLSLPCQCSGCCSGKGKGGSKRKNKGNKGEKPKDVRGASSGPPPDHGGS